MKILSFPGKPKPETRTRSKENSGRLAFTLTELVVVIAAVLLLAAMLLRTQASTRTDAMRLQCANNLKQVGLAFRVWAASHNDQFPMIVPTTQGGADNSSPPTPLSDGSQTYTVFMVM